MKLQPITLLLIVMIYSATGFSQVISRHFFGENAWMPDTIGNFTTCQEPPCLLKGQLHRQWANLRSSQASVIRFGGTSADENMPTNYQYIRMIDSIRANGMEPEIQIPFYNNRYTAEQAAEIVRYINITQGKKIKYWIIGNEPDQGYGYTTSAQVAAYFRPFASAMKYVDPSILIIGPELAWFNEPILNGLTTPNGPDDITGHDSLGNYYLDLISFHTYPFDGTQTREQVISNLTAPGSFQNNLISLNSNISACNAAHNRTGNAALKAAVTEANIDWKNSPSDNLNGTGANSFIGGQFIAEMMGIGMKNGLDFLNIWSVIEGNTIASDIGIIDAMSYSKKPSYFHFQLVAGNFSGNYLDGTSNRQNVKSFGCQNNQQICILILNEDQNASYPYTLLLNTTDTTSPSPLRININAGIAQTYSDQLLNESSILLTFDLQGILIKKCEYSLANNANANLAPTCTENILAAIAPLSHSITSLDSGLRIFPNPSTGEFTIQLTGENTEIKNRDILILNSTGQIVYRKTSVFTRGTEQIDLGIDFADGLYVIRVIDGDDILTKPVLLKK